jgi:integrase
MREALNAIARLLTNDSCDAQTLDWAKLRYQHTAAVRSVLMEKYSPAMANKMLCALRRVLQEAWRLGLMSTEDYGRATDIQSVRGKSLLKGRALDGEEIAALWENCIQDNSNLGARDAALLAILTVGLRRSEVTHLDLSDFKSRSRSLTIREAKGRRERIVYLPEAGVRAVQDWLLVRGKEAGPLFYPLDKGNKVIQRRMSEQGVLRALQRRGKLRVWKKGLHRMISAGLLLVICWMGVQILLRYPSWLVMRQLILRVSMIGAGKMRRNGRLIY